MEPQRHQVATRRTAAQDAGKRSGLEDATDHRDDLEQSLASQAVSVGPRGRSLQTDTSYSGPLHNPGLAWNRLP